MQEEELPDLQSLSRLESHETDVRFSRPHSPICVFSSEHFRQAYATIVQKWKDKAMKILGDRQANWEKCKEQKAFPEINTEKPTTVDANSLKSTRILRACLHLPQLSVSALESNFKWTNTDVASY